MNITTAQRFWDKVKGYSDPDKCWLWIGCATPSANGSLYGRFRLNGRLLMAHRIAYELMVGPIPKGLELDHLCRSTLCINPFHHEPVTHRVNIMRGRNLGSFNAHKTHCPKGHPYDDDNTYVYSSGSRSCRACHKRSI